MLLTERYSDERRLLKYGYHAYSQNDEDGIIAEIFRRIGTTSKSFVEIGVEDGRECNTLNLLIGGWSGAWVEQSKQDVAQARATFSEWTASGQLAVECATVTAANADELVKRVAPASEIDLLSIDIDGNDYWVWRQIESLKPRVVVIEYNAIWRPPLAVTSTYDEKYSAPGPHYGGVSLKALEILGRRKGYHLVGCCFAGVNAFFVKEDLCQHGFSEPFAAENHFEPFRLFMTFGSTSPRPGFVPMQFVPSVEDSEQLRDSPQAIGRIAASPSIQAKVR
ncbi:MAG: hypothetical protein ACREQR_14130 [Candidatus Binataceae bacterium]